MATTQNAPNLIDNEGRPIHPSWAKNEVALSIMRGDHDDALSTISQATAKRLKSMWRKGMAITLTGTKSPDLDGQRGVIIKVNTKTVTVGIGDATTDQWGTTYSIGEYNVPPSMLVKA